MAEAKKVTELPTTAQPEAQQAVGITPTLANSIIWFLRGTGNKEADDLIDAIGKSPLLNVNQNGK